MGKHQAPRTRRKWSERLYDGRLRAQCRACFDAGLRPAETVRVCPECVTRSARRRDEAQKFRAFLDDQARPAPA